MDGSVERQSTGGAKGARDQSYPLTIGLMGATERRPKLRKGTSIGPRKVCFFRSSLWFNGLKDTVMREEGLKVVTALVCRNLKVVSYSAGTRYRSIDMERHHVGIRTESSALNRLLKGEATTSWEGLIGWRSLARHSPEIGGQVRVR